jgi:hypothetical protein
MIAVIAIDERPCIVKWTGRKGLKIGVGSYCGQLVDAAKHGGVFQVPDQAASALGLCPSCVKAIRDPRSWTIEVPEGVKPKPKPKPKPKTRAVRRTAG